MAVAVYVVINRRTMGVVYRDHEWFPVSKIPPYVSTYLAFREIDPLERLVRKQLETAPAFTPGVVLVDGNGVFHPRCSGIACFLGVRTGIPTIGIGKTLLCIGQHGSAPIEKINGEEDGAVADRWNRTKLAERIDKVLARIHRIMALGVPASESSSELANRLSKHRGLILPWVYRHTETDESKERHETENELPQTDNTRPSSGNLSRVELLRDLAPYCNGIAIPLEAGTASMDHVDTTCTEKSDGDRPRGPHRPYSTTAIRGTALVGQGGGAAGVRRRKTSKASLSGGTIRPIIVSVGHRISLAAAASIAAALSSHRIPEPVRQADLYGRELLAAATAATVRSRIEECR